MWSGCWGKLTGNSIIGRLPPLTGNGDDDGYTPPHHNNGFTPPLRLGNWAAPSTLDHFLYSSVISRGIKLLKLYNWILSFYCGDSEGSNLNGENSHEESVVPMMTTALLSCDSKLNYWRGLLNRHVQSTRHYRYIRRYKLYSRGVQQPPMSACCLLSFEIKPTEIRIFEDLLRLISVAPRKAQTQTLSKKKEEQYYQRNNSFAEYRAQNCAWYDYHDSIKMTCAHVLTCQTDTCEGKIVVLM